MVTHGRGADGLYYVTVRLPPMSPLVVRCADMATAVDSALRMLADERARRCAPIDDAERALRGIDLQGVATARRLEP